MRWWCVVSAAGLAAGLGGCTERDERPEPQHIATGADPGGSDPGGADPQGADPQGADPQGADPQGADPSGADPSGGDAGGVDVEEVPCTTLTCDGHGRCVMKDGQPMCLCDEGYYGNLGTGSCVPAAGTECEGQTCSGHGTCVRYFFGGWHCVCGPGYRDYGGACVDERRFGCRDAQGNFHGRGTRRCSADDTHLEVCHDGDGDRRMEWIFGAECAGGGKCSEGCINAPCPAQPCPVGTACVESAHGHALGVCVATCDCENCGNCGLDNSDGRWNDMQEYCGAPGGTRATTACNLPCPDPGEGCIPYSPAICWPIEGCFSSAP